jgi:hypothetical protein
LWERKGESERERKRRERESLWKLDLSPPSFSPYPSPLQYLSNWVTLKLIFFCKKKKRNFDLCRFFYVLALQLTGLSRTFKTRINFEKRVFLGYIINYSQLLAH